MKFRNSFRNLRVNFTFYLILHAFDLFEVISRQETHIALNKLTVQTSDCIV